jgi:[glutamine synthetase] adenylyltransferase / [glutamine synthetase]-adenylyl-L-tyrosine phosphorylase
VIVRAESIAPAAAAHARQIASAAIARAGAQEREEVVELATLLYVAYPSLSRAIETHPEDVVAIASGLHRARDARAYRRLARASVPDGSEPTRMRSGLRHFATREKLRIAARELLAQSGHDVDVTSRELADLADVCCELALAEARSWASSRFGPPLTASGDQCAFVVVGMGKLGGRELNAGSDIDLMLFYETDEGASGEFSLHEHFTRVAQRFVATLEEPTQDGAVWRVDLRLRPEGTRGALVNALAAAERYYETWGRTWERAALVRARPIAGDIAFGVRMMNALSPFVWRRAVDPGIAPQLAALLTRARANASEDARDDLKIGPGGIREVEFFVQSLQLVWGGIEPRVRVANTHDALRRLRACGFVSEREETELKEAYLFLRRLEHRVQFATGLQTHALPRDAELRMRIAQSLGYRDDAELSRELTAVRSRVSARFASLQVEAGSTRSLPWQRSDDSWVERLWTALDGLDASAVAEAATPRFGAAASAGLASDLISLARLPDHPLNTRTRDRDPEFAKRLLDALADAADSEQAARLLASLFARYAAPGGYVRALAEDPRLVRALCSLLGASAFLGRAVVAHPELVDEVLYARDIPTAAVATTQVEEELAALTPDDARDVDTFVGALRRAKRRITFEVGLADLAGELEGRDVGPVLTALADATLDHAYRFASRERGHPSLDGLALIAMGSLGGREVGYASDLDLIFVYESGAENAAQLFARIAQRVLLLVGASHDEGPGYELDTRLRPSGSQGLLVTSVEAFARYQVENAEAWEHQALIKARACAGDRRLGERVVSIARAAAYDHGAPPPTRLHATRARMERELARERPPARFDIKVGRGGLVDIEFAVQWAQMKNGLDLRVRTTETEAALSALEACGYLDATDAEVLRDGWLFLRQLERRMRIAHGMRTTLIERGAPGLATLARAMGIHDVARARADEVLLERYVTTTREVRAAYLRILGLANA